jgi:hypothetical protein
LAICTEVPVTIWPQTNLVKAWSLANWISYPAAPVTAVQEKVIGGRTVAPVGGVISVGAVRGGGVAGVLKLHTSDQGPRRMQGRFVIPEGGPPGVARAGPLRAATRQ